MNVSVLIKKKKEDMKVSTNILFVAVLAASVAVAAYLGQSFLSIQKQAMYSQSVDGCMNVSKFVYQDNKAGTNSIMVVEDIYNKCLQLKKNNK